MKRDEKITHSLLLLITLKVITVNFINKDMCTMFINQVF